MDITNLVSTEFIEVAPETTVSKTSGQFDDPSVNAVIIRDDDGFKGVVTRRQLATSNHPPNEKLAHSSGMVPD